MNYIMKIDPNQTDLYLSGTHYVRKDASAPWIISKEEVTQKIDLLGNVTYIEVRGVVEYDIPPKIKQKFTKVSEEME